MDVRFHDKDYQRLEADAWSFYISERECFGVRRRLVGHTRVEMSRSVQ